MTYKLSILSVTLFLILYGLSMNGYGQSEIDLRDYCPDSGEVGKWFSEYEPRVANGDDLFLLINGGADIYLEYGFKKVILHSYKLPDGGGINLEIYQMESPTSAFGIYTFKSGNSGYPVDIGHEGWMEDYFLNFWKGDILVTLIGLDTEEETLQGIMKLAKAIDGKIESNGDPPDIVGKLPQTGLKPNGITYLKGNLALFNQYLFDSRNVFGFVEGIRGNYRDHDLFLFSYNSPEEASRWFDSAKKIFLENGLFKDLYEETKLFRMKDKNDQIVVIKPVNQFLVVFIGPPDMAYDPILSQISFD